MAKKSKAESSEENTVLEAETTETNERNEENQPLLGVPHEEELGVSLAEELKMVENQEIELGEEEDIIEEEDVGDEQQKKDAELLMEKMRAETKDTKEPVMRTYEPGNTEENPEEDAVDDEQIIKDFMRFLYEKRRTKMASKEEKKELYKEDRAIAKVKKESALTEKEERRKEFQYLMEAARSVPPAILSGYVVGFETTANGYDLVEVQLENSKAKVPIKMPPEHLFPHSPGTYADEMGKIHLRNEIAARMGAKVNFLIMNVNEKEGLVFGSCVAAQALQGDINYVRIRADNATPRVIEGMLVEARVVGVRKDRIRVNVAGVETTIHSGRDLAWTSLSSLKEEFRIGDTFYVKVLEIVPYVYTAGGREYNMIRLKVSRSQAMTNPADLYFKDFHEGQIVSGIIKAEAHENGVFVTLQNKMDAVCYIPSSGMVVMGKMCTVKITKCNEEKKQLTGQIIDIQE